MKPDDSCNDALETMPLETTITPATFRAKGKAKMEPNDNKREIIDAKSSQPIPASLNYNAAISRPTTALKSCSIHPFARTSSAKQPQQDKSSKTEMKKAKRGRILEKSSGSESGSAETKAVKVQETEITSKSSQTSKECPSEVLADVKDESRDNEDAVNVTFESPTNLNVHPSKLSVTSSSAMSEHKSDQIPSKPEPASTSTGHSKQSSVTFAKKLEDEASGITKRKIIPPALPLPVPYGKRPTFSAANSGTKPPAQTPDVDNTADAASDPSSPMSTRTAKEFQTPAPSPFPGSSSPFNTASTRDDGVEDLGPSNSDLVESRAPIPSPIGKPKKNKKKNKKLKQSVVGENASSKTDGNTKSNQVHGKSGEIKDRRDRSSDPKLLDRRATEGQSFEPGADKKRISITQDTAFEKSLLLKENTSANPDSWAHVASRNQSANAESTKQEGLTNRSPNLPGTVT
jgi:hypothetical protein